MSAAKRHILPFFIPMQGCLYHCVYCDQLSISGHGSSPKPQQIMEEILAYSGPRPAQVAFYGGSFTALPKHIQEAYLKAVQPSIRKGVIDSIRISTCPDAIDKTILARLAAWGVTIVELGIQSFDAHVLQAAGRAYSPLTAQRACLMVKEAGFFLGIQLMTGLPQDTAEKSLNSMIQGCESAADFFRIYPTLVLHNTMLAHLYKEGLYKPQELTQAVRLAADMLAIALQRGKTVIRLGLSPSPSLEQALLAGPYHPAFGHLVYSELKLRQALLLLEKVGKKKVVLAYPTRERPLLFGQKNEQWQKLQMLYPTLTAQAEQDLPQGALRAYLKGGETITLMLDDFLV